MNTRKFISLLFSGPNAFGKFFIGLHTKGILPPPGFSFLIDDESNILHDDEGNLLIAQD